ncbi:hypothetical protein ACFVRU_11330, partial [Streptomyces sp. NPDC057927]
SRGVPPAVRPVAARVAVLGVRVAPEVVGVLRSSGVRSVAGRAAGGALRSPVCICGFGGGWSRSSPRPWERPRGRAPRGAGTSQ